MPQHSPEVSPKPAVLKWARESSGWTIPEISKKLKVDPQVLVSWESGGQPTTFKHLEAIAKYYKRPLAALFLPSPPLEPPPPTDFRIIPGTRGRFAKKTLLAIRRSVRLQSIARELLTSLGRDLAPNIGVANPSDDPERVAVIERGRIGASLSLQEQWIDERQAFTAWREIIEAHNIYIFSLSMPLDDARGFSLAEQRPLAIVINSADALNARIFTLFHEFGHLLLRKPGICTPQGEWSKHAHLDDIEKWCNLFAAAFLMPPDIFKQQFDPSIPTSEFLVSISRGYKVSRQVALRRMLTLGLISRKRYWEEMEQLTQSVTIQKKGGRSSPDKQCIRENGPSFTRLVLESKERGFITKTDDAQYLGLRLMYLYKVRSLLAY